MLGETLDRKYKLIRLLGEGGMGAVYEAEQADTQRRIAVKIINSRLLTPGGEGIPRFRREARAAGAIDSDHIIRVLDSGHDEETGLLYLAMELLQGEDLQQLIDRCGALVPDVALRIAAQALIGLQKAHDANIIHRDIKPANLFLARGPDGAITVKLLDFGIAKIKVDPASMPQTTGLTSTGGILGSPLYMSPEQVQSSRDVANSTDLWSLGSTLYCALAGRAPHQEANSIGKLFVAICSSRPAPLREVAPWVSIEVAEAVHRALEHRPEARYASAAAMLDAIRPLVSGDLVLREDMFVSMSDERRAAPITVPDSGRGLTHNTAVSPVSGYESTEPLVGDESRCDESSYLITDGKAGNLLVTTTYDFSETDGLLDGRYKLLQVIGQGFAATVYRAEDLHVGSEVAIKCIHPEIVASPEYKARVMEEAARVMGALSGTSAAQIFSCNETANGTLYIVMELLQGRDLETILCDLQAAGGKLPIPRVLELFAPIIDTLQAAHGLGFIHRDIRPANIFVLEGSACGAVRLLFSIVKVGTKFSDPGQGTPVYTAPEVWRGQPELVDHQLDVFSLGATLFRVLAGHVPFVGLTRVDAVMAVMRGPEPSLSSLRPDLPPEIDAWTERALALHPGARFPDVRSLWDALTPLLGQSA